MTTGNTQRELIDYLWEWAESKGFWAKLLVHKVTTSQAPLTQIEKQEVFNYYLQEITFIFEPPLPPINISKPTFTLPTREISLTKLSEVKGVNRLAEDQVMEFSPNITVVYGNNGVGKTGYSRVLKAQGYSFDSNNDILSNVHEEQVGQSAKIEFTLDGNPFYINWEGINLPSDLNAVSVFNSDCVNISLSSNRELLVTPKGFYLFSLITNELTALSAMHTQQYSLYPIKMHWSEQLIEGTPQKLYIDSLAPNSDKQKLEELSLYTQVNQDELSKKEDELKKLNKATLEVNLKNIDFILTELATNISMVRNIQSNLTKNDWDIIIKYNAALQILKAKTKKGIAGLAETHGLEQFNTVEFNTFLKSADSYIKLIAKENYPNNADDTCVYCKQDLQNEHARNLIESYSKILNDTTQEEIVKYKKLKTDIAERVNLLNDGIMFHYPAFGLLENNSIVQPKEIIDFNSKVKLYKSHIVNDSVSPNTEFEINYKVTIQFLEKKQKELITSRDSLIKALANLETAEIKLKKEIAELKDRKLLSVHKQEVLTCISNLSARKLLDDNKVQFNTMSLSAKTTQAREELVAQDFQDKFTAELKGFRKQHLDVNIGFFSQQGSSRIRQNIRQYDINKVLSEGEQKTIALCEFLTELQLDTTVAPVVFDDPVNSLDHNVMQDVAKRLADLSKERQVIVFTHNVLFYNAFFALQSHVTYKTNTDFNFYKVNTNGINTGLLSEGTPINKLKTYTSKLNIICNNGLGGKNENEVASEGYAYLRAGLELLVSNSIFKEIVGRYRNNIMMTLFPAVKGDMIEKHKAEIDGMFGRASGFIRAHSHPEEQHSPPTMNDLKADYKRFKIIEKDFK
ncbi:AAA family ATPase [Winogradskyella sp. F6397]|uniref:AAA family ATPase n=1 Tax=Winogradskyella marina TaxID=2785530 RepID=A0ABS0EJ34_9FLAO|nr:AAA family ATPase [Winogradskyella marina]MBF8149490.1 AAA family ATPase [Winogradskyella marina]